MSLLTYTFDKLKLLANNVTKKKAPKFDGKYTSDALANISDIDEVVKKIHEDLVILDANIIPNTLASGKIFVGNSSNVATVVTMSGAVTISNTGVTTINNVISAPLGGTGQSVYAIGDILYANTTTTLAKLADIATGNSLISGGIGVAPSWGKIGLTTHVSGTLPIANGGSGQTTANAALNAFLPSQTSNSGKYLTTNGTDTSWATVTGTTNPLVAYDNLDRSHTGDTTPTIIGTPLLIPGNTMGVNGILDIDMKYFKVGVNNADTVDVYINTVNNLTGTPILIASVSYASTTLVSRILRRIVNKNSLSVNNSYPTLISIDTGNNINARIATNIDFSVDQYLIIRITLANASDQVGYDYLNIFVRNP